MSIPAGEHFDKIASAYAQARETWACLYRQMQPVLAPLTRDRVVLDVGNGGIFAYDPGLTKLTVAADISPAMLASIDQTGVERVVCDAHDLSAFDDCSVDVALYCFSIHHMTGETVSHTLTSLDSVLASAARVLRPGGALVVAEPVVRGSFLWWLERALYPVTYWYLRRRSVSMAFFYDLRTLTNSMCRHLGLDRTDLNILSLDLEGWSDPLGGTLPGRLRLPPSLHPAMHCLIVGRKGRHA